MKLNRVHITLLCLLVSVLVGGLVGISVICYEQKERIKVLKQENVDLEDAKSICCKAYKMKSNQLNKLSK